MNKIQYIKLLNLRGITELQGITIADAVKQTGGEPTDKEMVEVNHQAMMHYIDKFTEQKEINKKLGDVNEKLQERDNWLNCLEAAGVDNWDGYDIAQDMRDES
jgi:hypothetical protein